MAINIILLYRHLQKRPITFTPKCILYSKNNNFYILSYTYEYTLNLAKWQAVKEPKNDPISMRFDNFIQQEKLLWDNICCLMYWLKVCHSLYNKLNQFVKQYENFYLFNNTWKKEQVWKSINYSHSFCLIFILTPIYVLYLL